MHLLEEFNIEIGAGLGPLAGKIWRVGLMGASSSPRLIVLLRGALESALAKQGRRDPRVTRRRRVRDREQPAAGPTTRGRPVTAVRQLGSRCLRRWLRAARLRLPHAARTSGRCRTTNPSTTAFIELRAREARAKGQQPRARAAVGRATAAISPDLKRAVLVAEDDAFWQHEGVDFDQLQESLELDWARGRFARGGSTITQQLAKNLYLSPSKNPLRKLRELIIARRLEAELKKARILELYLNVIEWGDGVYGVEAAARTYFHTSCGRSWGRPSRRCSPPPSSTRDCSILHVRRRVCFGVSS